MPPILNLKLMEIICKFQICPHFCIWNEKRKKNYPSHFNLKWMEIICKIWTCSHLHIINKKSKPNDASHFESEFFRSYRKCKYAPFFISEIRKQKIITKSKQIGLTMCSLWNLAWYWLKSWIFVYLFVCSKYKLWAGVSKIA